MISSQAGLRADGAGESALPAEESPWRLRALSRERELLEFYKKTAPIALAQCFKPITYKIDQHRNEPWQVLAQLPLLNNGSEQVHTMFLSICSSPRLDKPFYKNPKSTIR